MKTVILMRHADSYPTDFSGYEDERPVSVTGLLQIEQIRVTARNALHDVDFVLCSGIKRAKQTFQAIFSPGSARMRFMFDDLLSQNTAPELLDKIQWFPSIYHNVLIIGHNPGLSLFIRAVLPNDPGPGLSTCEMAVFDAPVNSWQDISYNNLSLRERVRPEGDSALTGSILSSP